ncbi:hybrid sensor histidine kinase/response regulator [Idiomarina seosinensis]|uniref:PAS domain-containing hybrid sensor histidine kinase/response regulator n=1 Tax=Idiomarina seosinensis TaxID=281739 RepID=UPI00384A7CB2
MLSVSVTAATAIIYLIVLFFIAYRGDGSRRQPAKPYRYSLAQGVHCTSWAFFGTVTQSAHYGWSFAPTYIGAIAVFLFLHSIQLRILNYCKQQNITSIADLIGTRYGKSPLLASVVALTALIAVVPYISLQLRAVTASFSAITGVNQNPFWLFDLSALVALVMIAFGFLFATRRLSLAEQHSGLMDAMAFESIVKLLAFMAVGLFATYSLFDGFNDLLAASLNTEHTRAAMEGKSGGLYVYIVHVLLGALSMFCLPRQFHVTYVENTHSDELRVARWAFPLYLFAINFFILPIAMAALLIAPEQATNDTFMLVLPLSSGRTDIALIAFIGGLAAATSMVLIALLALSIMISNDLVMPLWLRLTRQRLRPLQFTPARILLIRRVTIIIVMLMAYIYYQLTIDSLPLVNSGLISLALLVQLAPAIIASVLWPRSHQLGVISGLLAGALAWLSLLLLPALNTAQPITDIQVADGVLISLGLNLTIFILTSVLIPNRDHRVQTTGNDDFIRQPSLSWSRLHALLERFYSPRQLHNLQQKMNLSLLPLDDQSLVPAPTLVRIERELSTIIGTSATRLLFDTISEQQELPVAKVVDWATEASKLYRFNRELLQASVENIPQGISVIDQELRLVAWNRRYIEIFDYPEGLVRAGMPVEELLRYNAARGMLSQSNGQNVEAEIEKRLNYLRAGSHYQYQRAQGQLIIELQGNPMPGGGFVTTYSDITEKIDAQKALQHINEQLEQRVAERTEQLLSAKQAEEKAHVSKSRFFAAVSHDLMQPFNAASLFCEMLQTKVQPTVLPLAINLQRSLEHAEELLTMLLDMTKLDAGNLTPERQTFALDNLLQPLVDRYQAMAAEKGLRFDYVASSAIINSDRKLLTRVIQNLLSNAIRYTQSGRIILGVKRHQQQATVWIIDTGEGIPTHKQEDIFREFHQLQASGDNPGLGLGLSIVERVCRLLAVPLQLRSSPGKGTAFGITLTVQSWHKNTEADTPSAVPVVEASLLAGYRVLVIDNDRRVLSATSTLLEQWGAKVYPVADQQQALQVPACDLIFADYHLDNGITGIDVVIALRQHWQCNTPAIINSADPNEQLREQALEINAQFIPKPLKSGALKRLIKRVRSR